MSNPQRLGISPAVAEQAVQWLIEWQEGSLSEQRLQAWQHWRSAASEHEQAWQRIESVNQRLRGLPAQTARQVLDAPPSRRRREGLKALLVLAGLGVTGWGLQRNKPWQPWLADAHTDIGERRELALADGSQLILNTDSAVNLRVDAEQRLLELQRGEIFLQVREATRPLRIDTSLGYIETRSARLCLRLHGERCRVSLFDGVATIQPRDASALQLQDGQQLSFGSQHVGLPQPVDANGSAWTRGMLVVSQMRLADFLAELGRYRPGRLSCDPQIADLRISGSYPLDHSERILALLPRALPVEVRQLTRYWVSVHPRQAAT
ncbi:FecR domain-containing protein [Pseudomonas sp. ML96]|uniref:FecR domain-containing protein n=1 Tax=Pseudomonas sp. ML96 TaxID=1523503 RepID=UPI00069224C5|nr:FecR family protein [Pseudomonas sp. ML96]